MSESTMAGAMVRMQQRIESLERELSRVPSRFAGCYGFWAKLTAAEEMDSGIWRYTFEEVEFTMESGLLTPAVTDNGKTGPFVEVEPDTMNGYAWNVNELYNNVNSYSGSGWPMDGIVIETEEDDGETPHIHEVNVSDGINPIFIDGENEPIVWIEARPSIDDNSIAYLFCGWNTPHIDTEGGGA